MTCYFICNIEIFNHSNGQDSAAREALEWLRGTNRVDQVLVVVIKIMLRLSICKGFYLQEFYQIKRSLDESSQLSAGLGDLVKTLPIRPLLPPLACVRIVHACKAATRWGQCWGYLYPGAFLCRLGRLFRPNQPWSLLMQPSRPSPSARALPPPSSPHLTFPLLRVPPPHYPMPSVQSWQA